MNNEYEQLFPREEFFIFRQLLSNSSPTTSEHKRLFPENFHTNFFEKNQAIPKVEYKPKMPTWTQKADYSEIKIY